jgi:hypothetical protein
VKIGGRERKEVDSKEVEDDEGVEELKKKG